MKKMTKTINKALIDRGMTVTQLAERICRHRVYTSNVINCHFAKPPLKTIKLISKELGIPVETLMLEGTKRAA